MYFETGQGAPCLPRRTTASISRPARPAPTRSRARFEPLLVNTVVGFIGPEYLYDGKQIIRAGLEDHFCGKLLGLPMGCDVCYTNHAEADQDDMDTLLTLLGVAGVNYIMGVPGADDIMLNYQSTSFHDALYIRELLSLKCAPEFESWLQQMRIVDATGRLRGEHRRFSGFLLEADLELRNHELYFPEISSMETACAIHPGASGAKPRRGESDHP